MASSIAAVVLLVAGVLVAVNVSGGRAYADLPTCQQLLGDLTDEIPGADSPSVDGDSLDDLDGDVSGHYAGETYAEARSGVECEVEDPGRDDGTVALRVHVYLYDHEDERGLTDLHRQMEEEMESYEDGSLEAELDEVERMEWEQVGIGDGGILALEEYSPGPGDTGDTGDTARNAYGLFLTDNLSASYEYAFEDRDDEEEVMAFIRSFGQDLERQLRSEGEFV